MAFQPHLGVTALNRQLAIMPPAMLAAAMATQPLGMDLRLPVPNYGGRRSARRNGNVHVNNLVRAGRRQLNSYMAFRSFYIPVFLDDQQKEVSAYLSILWQQDPFKAKWTILAKVYSMIRDKIGKKQAPLDKFLEFACPAMGIIAVDDYLLKFNWVMNFDNDGKKVLQQLSPPDLTSFSRHILCTTMTEIDLFGLAIAIGYMPPAEEFFQYPQNSAEILMAASPQFNPTSAKVTFFQAISQDPKGIAAQILGFDINHPFLQISSAANEKLYDSGLVTNESAEYIKQVVERNQGRAPIQAQRQYNWTGSMSELYRPAEPYLNLADDANGQEWGAINLNDPAALDGFLESNGYDANFLQPNLPDDPNMVYNFWDSF